MGGRSRSERPPPAIDLLLRWVDEAYDRRAWHGTTLRGSLRGITASQAVWRPAPTRHNIWEIVLHCAYWKYAVRRRLTDQPRGTFALAGSDWFATPAQATADAWRDAVRLLGAEHKRFRAVIRDLSEDGLEQPTSGGTTRGSLARGVAAHDLYHAGQVQLLKKLRAGP